MGAAAPEAKPRIHRQLQSLLARQFDPAAPKTFSPRSFCLTAQVALKASLAYAPPTAPTLHTTEFEAPRTHPARPCSFLFIPHEFHPTLGPHCVFIPPSPLTSMRDNSSSMPIKAAKCSAMQGIAAQTTLQTPAFIVRQIVRPPHSPQKPSISPIRHIGGWAAPMPNRSTQTLIFFPKKKNKSFLLRPAPLAENFHSQPTTRRLLSRLTPPSLHTLSC